jgi:glyoxylase-like metal-dependent hydrolase (beta-lactamase superfamily II)
MVDVGTEVFAIRYASLRTTRSASFLDFGGYGEPDAPMDMDYFLWVIRTATDTVVVDTGFDPAVGRRRGRDVHADPVAALGLLGISPSDVDQVVISHFHYDHVGNAHRFGSARMSCQRSEVEFWLDRDSSDPDDAALVEPDEIKYLRSAVASGQVRCLDGDTELAAGVWACHVGGHTPGQQMVVVDAGDRPVVLASDAIHFYEEMDRDRPYVVADDVAAMRTTYRRLRTMAAEGAVVVAGHDPRVMTRFPAVPAAGTDLVVRILP